MYSFCNEENKPLIEMRAENQMTMSYAFGNNAHECKAGADKVCRRPRLAPKLVASDCPPRSPIPSCPEGHSTVLSLWDAGSVTQTEPAAGRTCLFSWRQTTAHAVTVPEDG